MSAGLDRDPLFVGLTRPQTFAGVTYAFFIINLIATTELFLVFKSVWVLLLALVVHGVGILVSVREPRIFDLWLTRIGRTPRVRNHGLWRCNSYRP